jgi:1-acyl-sn-glycerol-3-phosphate acyltransferase
VTTPTAPVPPIERAPSSPLLATLRLVTIVLGHAVLAVVYLFTPIFLFRRRPLERAAWMTRLWGAMVTRVWGIRLVVEGPTPPAPALIAPNHMGYLDIFPLAASVPLFFVVREQVNSVPVAGAIIRWSMQPVMRRERSRALTRAGDVVRERLEAGGRVVIFLEGTSTGGDRVLPFNTGFVQPAIDAAAPIVPVGLRWSGSHPGLDIAEDVAYWKDHEFKPHCWRALGLRGLTLTIRFGEPIPTAGGDRKKIARAAREAVCQLAGLPPIDERAWVDPNPPTR